MNEHQYTFHPLLPFCKILHVTTLPCSLCQNAGTCCSRALGGTCSTCRALAKPSQQGRMVWSRLVWVIHCRQVSFFRDDRPQEHCQLLEMPPIAIWALLRTWLLWQLLLSLMVLSGTSFLGRPGAHFLAAAILLASKSAACLAAVSDLDFACSRCSLAIVAQL